MKRTRSLFILLVVGLCFYSAPAQADPVTWNFSVPLGDLLSSSHPYLDTTSTYSIGATGFTNAGIPSGGSWTLGGGISANNLYGKSAGAGETGLGLTGTPDFEIIPGSLIQLNLQNLQANNLIDEVKSIGSVQDGETWAIFGSNTPAAGGVTGTLLATGTGGGIGTYSAPGSIVWQYEWITATSGDVLLDDGLAFSTNAIPEPITLLLVGSGLVGLAGYGRRRFKK